MVQTYQNGHSKGSQTYDEQAFGETPFADPQMHEDEDPQHEWEFGESWEFTTPFLPGEAGDAGESETIAPEVGEFSEIVTELRDTAFRESLEQLADEALEARADRIAGEYGDRESRDLAAERLLNEHFEPLAAEAEAMLDRFFERLESYETESLTDTEIDRVASEVAASVSPPSPASEQFLGGLVRKAGRLVSGAVNLAKKGLSVLGKLLGPLLKPLKKLARYLLEHVTKAVLGKLPPALRPLAQKLSDRLAHALGETYEREIEGHEQTESEVLPAAPGAARLEAEFDVHAAQLLFSSDEYEMDRLVSSYGESESYSPALSELEDARAQLVFELSRLEPGENVQPVMEQFLPALIWPAVKTAITLIGRGKVVKFIGGLLAKLIQNLLGAQAAQALGPALADAGLRVFGFETSSAQPRAALAEALAATIEETVDTIGELPTHVLENETLLTEAVHEAFENAAAAYFLNSTIKPELRESAEPRGRWERMPANSEDRTKAYAKYSEPIHVEVSPRVAKKVETFGGATLHDHFRDHHGLPEGQPVKGKATLYQALPGTTGSTIARAEKFPPSQLHPLTPQAAGALLGPNASLGNRPTPPQHMASPQKLHVGQRLYRIEPPMGRHRHVHRIHSELLINLRRGEIRLWLYLSEPLCQKIALDLSKGSNAPAAFKRLKHLLLRTSEALKLAVAHHHLPPEILVVSETPNLTGKAPHWLGQIGRRFGAKIGEWAQVQLAQYLRNHAEEFKRACASHYDGVTLRITMTRIPGIEMLRLISQGKQPKEMAQPGWPQGSPAFQVVARSGYAINRLRD